MMHVDYLDHKGLKLKFEERDGIVMERLSSSSCRHYNFFKKMFFIFQTVVSPSRVFYVTNQLFFVF